MLKSIFMEIEDPRSYHGKEYGLAEILSISVLAILSNAKTYVDISTFIEEHFSLLKEYYNLKWRRFPTQSCIQKIFTRLNIEDLENAFRDFAKKLLEKIDCPEIEQIAFDGKTLRGSYSPATNQRGKNVFSALETSHKLVIAHFAAGDEKEHEIQAFQKMLESLNLQGKVLTADAIHCQKKLLN